MSSPAKAPLPREPKDDVLQLRLCTIISLLREDYGKLLDKDIRRITRENPTIDLRRFVVAWQHRNVGAQEHLEKRSDWFAVNDKFPNLLGDFDPEKPRIYKGVWL